MATFEELFAGRNLTAMVQGVKPGVPMRIPEQLLEPTDEINGHTFEWMEVDGQRDIARITSQDGPAHTVGHQDAKRKSATMIRSFERQAFVMNDLRNLLTANGQVRDRQGRAYVRRQTEWFKRRLMNLKIAAASQMLFNFRLDYDEKGGLLPSSSGAVVSVVPDIPAGQTGQLDILGNGAIIGASWSNSGTDIMGHLAEIREQMLKLGNWQVTEAFYGKNIPDYIANNTRAKEYIDRTPALARQQVENARKVPDGFQGFNWHNASDAYWIDASGNVQEPLGDDEIVFTPALNDAGWWKHGVGSEMVPTGLGRVGNDANAMFGSVQEVMGDFSYATMAQNPLSIEQFAGCNFLPVISATKAVCKADVTP